MASAPEPNGRSLWHLDPGRLIPGDILLEHDTGPISTIIRAVDGGDYSHALLWLGSTSLVEAVGQGARVISFARIVIDDPSKWLLLRYPDASAAARASVEARNIAHKAYNLRGALNTQLRLPMDANPAKLFCSQLVAEAYHRAGVELVRGIAPARVTPRLLQTASNLAASPAPVTQFTAPIRQRRSRCLTEMTIIRIRPCTRK
jgi:hypothetical protein